MQVPERASYAICHIDVPEVFLRALQCLPDLLSIFHRSSVQGVDLARAMAFLRSAVPVVAATATAEEVRGVRAFPTAGMSAVAEHCIMQPHCT